MPLHMSDEEYTYIGLMEDEEPEPEHSRPTRDATPLEMGCAIIFIAVFVLFIFYAFLIQGSIF